MAGEGRTRQTIWFALGVLAPGALLLVFGVLLIWQETELAERRAQDTQALQARAVADSLQSGLERRYAALPVETSWPIRFPGDAGLLYLGDIRSDRFEPAGPGAASSPRSPSFQRTVQAANQAQNQGQTVQAIRTLSRALSAERDSTRLALLNHQVARLRFVQGDTTRALAAARSVLAEGPGRVDEYANPVAFFTAELLLTHDRAVTEVCRYMDRVWEHGRWLEPTAFGYAKELSARGDCAAAPAGLQTEYALHAWARGRGASLTVSGGQTLSAWQPAPGGWLVRFADPGRSDAQPVVAVRLSDLGAPVTAAQTAAAGQHHLAPLFPGLVVSLGEPASPWITRPGVLVIALLLVFAMTAFGGVLLWRDVRREARLSKLKSQFVSSVSHEVRTPLTSIRLFAEAMLEYGPGSEEQQKQSLEVIAYESGRLTRMLNNVLETSRIERGAVQYTLREGDLSEVAHRASEALRYAFDRRGVSLHLNSSETPARFDADAMEQAVVNLLANALKYGEGSNVEMHCRPTGTEALLSVTDHGPGIAPDLEERVFERFVQAAPGRGDGVGLGLLLVRHIAEGHGGRASLATETGRGCTFTLHLPLSP